jgi:hypothetical protein
MRFNAAFTSLSGHFTFLRLTYPLSHPFIVYNRSTSWRFLHKLFFQMRIGKYGGNAFTKRWQVQYIYVVLCWVEFEPSRGWRPRRFSRSLALSLFP